MPAKQHPDLLAALTQRELEILATLPDALSNAEIAERLFLSPATVKWYLKQIYSKLGVTGRFQALAHARKLGLLVADTPDEALTAPSVAAKHNLPRAPAPFVGREREIGYIRGLLSDANCRLVTLVGPGGIGKTRLAVEVAEQVAAAFADGIWFVHLQPVDAAEQVVHAVAGAIGFAFDAAHEPRAQLIDHLRDQTALLILDNLEHLLDSADLIAEMLAAAPRIKLIATSREGLNLREEWQVPLEGLPYPDDHQTEALETYSAVQLFVTRARRVHPGFTLNGQEAAIVSLCRLVGGIPLALELAAAWVRAISPSDIVAQISRDIDFLSAPWHDMPARHQSMRAVFDGSWQQLSTEQQAVFRSLAVFRGGFTAEAATHVAQASLTDIAALIDKSLVQMGTNARYDLHELLRQYALEKLDETAEFKESVLNRHCEYYMDFLHQQEATIHLSDQADVLEEIDNVRAAWLRAVQQRNSVALQRAAPALHWLFHFQGRYDEGETFFYLAEEAFREVATTDDDRYMLATMPLFRAFFRPERASHLNYPPVDIEAALAVWDTLEERPEMGLPLSRAMISLANHGGELSQVVPIARKSLAFSRRHNDPAGEAIALATLGTVTLEYYGDFAEAERFLDEALRIDQQIGFHLNARWVEAVLSIIAKLRGQYEAAKDHAEASVAYHRTGNITRLLDDRLLQLGAAELELGNSASALAHFAESMALAERMQRHAHVARVLAGYGLAAAYEGDYDTAATYYQQSLARLGSHGIDAASSDVDTANLDLLALLLGEFDVARLHYEAEASHFSTVRARTSLMTCHCRLGHALIGLDEHERARLYLFGTLREARACGAYSVVLEALAGIAHLSLLPPPVAVTILSLVQTQATANRYSRTLVERLLPLLNVTLAPDEFTAAVARGHTLSLDAGIALVEPFGFDVGEDQRQANEALVEPLSRRELEVLVLVGEGLTNREIADQMVVGVSTIKKHINHIYSKLDVSDRDAVVRRAKALRLIS